MAKRKSHTRRRKKQPLNWPLIVSAAVLISAFFLAYLTLGGDFLKEIPGAEEVKGAFSTLWEALTTPPEEQSRADSSAAGAAPIAGDGAEVHFIDVGQGDSILIRCGGADILIDAGENNMGETVNAYLDSLGVEELALAIGTHPHSDHIGGLDVVLSEHPAGTVVMPALPDDMVPTTRTFEDLLAVIEEENLSLEEAVPGTEYEFGDGTLEILGPVADYDDLNDYSVVCRFSYGEISFLLTGDMETTAEADLLASGADLSADILKLGHHGSSTSTGEDFLRAVDPAACVIEVGEGNSYNHPHAETMERVEGCGCTVYRTDLDGNIVIRTDGAAWSASTGK